MLYYHALVVRLFSVIGQFALRPRSGCPILRGYRTSCFTIELRLSDSSGLSDNLGQGPAKSLTEVLSFFLLVIILILSIFCCQQGENMAV